MKKTIKKRSCYALFWAVCSMLMLSAPQLVKGQDMTAKKVSGKVAADDGKPLPGATIVVKGTNNRIKTDVNGDFSLLVNEKDVIVVSYVGYDTREITVGKKTSFGNITIAESNSKNGNEVVVIGYGTVRRKDVTGAISSVSGDELRKSQPTTIDQALQGKVPGVVVQQVSGQPGGGVSIQIRGVSSFSNNPPMYVIDGVIMNVTSAIDGTTDGSGTNPLSSINPSEIESIDVLKDASATAIYGSQATNGVIVITTKRGKAGAPRITYDFYAGNQSLSKYYSTMNLQQYATFMNAKSAIIGYDLRPQFTNPQYLGQGTNWQKTLFNTAPMSNHSVGISGGDTRTQYFLSGSYFSQDGIAIGSNFNRISVRLNLDNKTTDWLKVGTSIQLANVREKIVSTTANVILTALVQTPDVSAQNANGSYGGNDPNIYGAYAANPLALAQIEKNNKTTYEVFGNAYAEILFSKQLSLRNEVSTDFNYANQDQFIPTYQFGAQAPNLINSSTYTSAQAYTNTIRNYVTYNNVFGNKYSLNVLVGHEGQVRANQNSVARRTNFPSNNVQAINAGDPTTATNSGTQVSSAQESYFGRVNFSYNSKYLFTANLRDDGSSKFAPGNRWVTTYSGAFAWKLGDEKLISKMNFFNDLKLRVGYGLTNNQNILNNAYIASLNTVANGLSGTAQLTANLPNPDVKWETTKSSNIGLDGSILKSRIQFTVDVYNRKTEGLLLSLPLPAFSGTTPSTAYSPGAMTSPYKNVGSVSNKGFDLSLTTINFQGKNPQSFGWRTTFIVSHNINKILSLNSDNDALVDGVAKSVVGRSLAEFYGYKVDGIFTTPADFKSHTAIPVNSATGVPYPITPGTGGIWYGDRMFHDVNGDGIIDERDQTFLGSPRPTYQLGFNNVFTFKNFDFTVFFSANLGNKIYNQLNVAGSSPNQNFGYFTSVLNYAKIAAVSPTGSATDVNNFYVSNPGTNIVRISQSSGNTNERFSDRYIEDGSFLRCKTMSLGYTFSKDLLAKVHLGSLRIYANVSNVFIITKYSGYDPEVGSYDPLQAGVDNGYYPQPRVFTFGANLSFLNK